MTAVVVPGSGGGGGVETRVSAPLVESPVVAPAMTRKYAEEIVLAAVDRYGIADFGHFTREIPLPPNEVFDVCSRLVLSRQLLAVELEDIEGVMYRRPNEVERELWAGGPSRALGQGLCLDHRSPVS